MPSSSSQSKNLGVGGKLQRHLRAWRSISGDYLIRKGLDTDWAGAPPPAQVRPAIRKEYKGVMHTFYQAELAEELQQGIIREVDADQCQWFSQTFLVPKPNGEWRKIVDCRLLNSYLERRKFKMEDHRTVAAVIEANHWAVSIDISKAYHHVTVSEELQPYLSFQYGKKIYQYMAMPFGISSAPRTFCKIMGHAMRVIRERWRITAVQYLDDLLFLHPDREVLQRQAQEIVTFLQDLGWTINREKSKLIPRQRFTFLGMEWNSTAMTIRLEREKKDRLVAMTRKWILRSRKGKTVSMRKLAQFIGRLSQSRMQHKRASIYLSKCNLLKAQAVQRSGWNGMVRLTPHLLSEIKWWNYQLRRNEPTDIRPRPPTATLFTDASPQGWGGWLTVNEQHSGEWMTEGVWTEQTPQTSNFREMTAVLRTMQHFFNLQLIQPDSTILLRSDNTTTIYDINKFRAARTLIAPLKEIMNFVWERKIHLQAEHIPGIENVTADKLSRMERSGDYELNQEVLDSALQEMGEKIDIDLFANTRNKKCQRYVTVSRRAGAAARDAFSMEWKPFCPLIHPPIPLILRCLQKIQQEGGKGIVILPAWKGQVWANLLHRMLVKSLNLGVSKKVLVPGKMMSRHGTELPPGTLLMCLVRASTRMDGNTGMTSSDSPHLAPECKQD
jgi:hypothetical protein